MKSSALLFIALFLFSCQKEEITPSGDTGIFEKIHSIVKDKTWDDEVKITDSTVSFRDGWGEKQSFDIKEATGFLDGGLEVVEYTNAGWNARLTHADPEDRRISFIAKKDGEVLLVSSINY